MNRFLTSSAAVLALCLAAAPVLAQSGNMSNATQGNNTSSGIAGGVFTPTASGLNAAAFSSAVGSAVGATAASIRIGVLSTGSINVNGQQVSGTGVTAVGQLMSGSAAANTQVSTALSTSGAPAGMVTALTNALQGLLTNPTAAGLSNAVTLFNSLVNNASASFLANPPAEFQAIFGALSQMVQSGNAAANSSN